MLRSPIIVLAVALFAGCASPEREPAPLNQENGAAGPVDRAVEGIVTSTDLIPIEGANVSLDEEAYAITDATGAFRFAPLERRDYTIHVERHGFRSQAQRAALEHPGVFQLRFELQDKPTGIPYFETQVERGFLACSISQGQGENQGSTDCGMADPNQRAEHTLPFGPYAAQMQVELFWEPTTAGSAEMTLRLDLPEDQEIAWTRSGPPGLKSIVMGTLLTPFQVEGSYVESLVEVSSSDELLQSTYLGLAFQQPFDLYSTTFYWEPGPPDFSIQDAG